MTKHRFLMLMGCSILLLSVSENSWGWSRLSHKRMTFWAWTYAGLPRSELSISTEVPVDWSLDTIDSTLGFREGNKMSVFMNIATGISFEQSDGSFDVHVTWMIDSDMKDSSIFMEWGWYPDSLDAKTAILGGALLGHMYIPAGPGFADGMCKYFFEKAVEEYKHNQQRRAYAYLAMAAHYLEDVGFPPHNEKSYMDLTVLWQSKYHGEAEGLIASEPFWSDNFETICDSFARAALPACDPIMAVHSLAWEGTWYVQAFMDAYPTNDPTHAKLIDICKKCIRAIMPRVTGLFLAFKQRIQ